MKSRSHSSNGLCPICASRNKEKPSKGECSICHNQIFERIGGLLKLAKNHCSNTEFSSFSVSSKIPREFELAEESLWDRIGLSNALSLKTQLNSEIASELKNTLKKKFSPDSPGITFIFDFEENDVKISVSPLFLYGHYKKFSRELSQTKWPCDCKSGCELCKGTLLKYLSVEDLISKPLLKAFRAKSAKFHGAGREDVDARMLGDGRPFAIELEEPLKRNTDLASLQNSINSEFPEKIELSRLSFAPPTIVEFVKMARLEKSYCALVQTTGPIQKQKLAKIPHSAKILQQTPNRVLHRRANLERPRLVKRIMVAQLSQNSLEFILDTESGTYVKEFISGDGGRTKPSISEFLGVPATCAELDVIGIKHFFLSDYW